MSNYFYDGRFCEEEKVEGLDNYQDFLRILGKTVKDMRKDRGFTQLELAKKANRTQSSVAKIETAPPADITLRVVYELAGGFSMNVSDLLKAAESRSKILKQADEKVPEEFWHNLQEVVKTLPEDRAAHVKRVITELIAGAQTM